MAGSDISRRPWGGKQIKAYGGRFCCKRGCHPQAAGQAEQEPACLERSCMGPPAACRMRTYESVFAHIRSCTVTTQSGPRARGTAGAAIMTASPD